MMEKELMEAATEQAVIIDEYHEFQQELIESWIDYKIGSVPDEQD